VGTMATPAAAWSPEPAGDSSAQAGSSTTWPDWVGLANWNWPAWNWTGWDWSSMHPAKRPTNHIVTIPEEDRFTPFALTIHRGDSVTWVNRDTDDHTVVSDDAFTTTDNTGVDQLLPGTDSNNGRPSRFTLTFREPGTFLYFCRFHSHLDNFSQPVAPGPEGGIQDADGNFGTPMMGVITVLGDDQDVHKGQGDL
jgi:plastocyanin